MKTDDMETDILKFIENHMESLENDLDPDMHFLGTEGIRRRFYEKSAVGPSEAESRRKAADIGNRDTGRRRKKRRKVYLVMAAVLVLLCGMGAAASYGKWRLPMPDTFTGDITKVKETEETSAQTQQLTDTYFLEKTREILKLINNKDVDTTRLKISHQKDEWWNREEVMVSFAGKEGEGQLFMTFDRETGYFLKADCFGNEETSGNLMSEEEALAAARGWYEKLPYPQGYEYTYVSKFDDETWMYSFCRKVDAEINGEILHLTNAYEEVRIGINPKTGDFVICNAFYVPLLDDHKEGDVPLSKERAVEIAADTLKKQNLDPAQAEIAAGVEIVHPNYTFTPYGWNYGQIEDEKNLRMSSVTRLAWDVIFTAEREYFTREVRIYVDLYTGEVLGGDEAK